MGKENSLHILPPHTELRQALQSAPSSVEHKFLVSGLHQRARPEAVHDRGWATGTQQGHLDLLALCCARVQSDDRECREYSKKSGQHVFSGSD